MKFWELMNLGPVVIGCAACQGVKGLWSRDGILDLPADLVLEYLEKGPSKRKREMCSCQRIVQELAPLIQALPLTLDTGWEKLSSSRESRGIVDYGRTMTFERKLSEQEEKNLVQYLHHHECPGWTGVKVLAVLTDTAGWSYRLKTTWDSSD